MDESAGRSRLTCLALTSSIALLAVVACGGERDAITGASSDCIAAFRNAEPRAGRPLNVSPLDDAIRACPTLADWHAAWDTVPGAHPSGTDAMRFLEGRCQVDSLRGTALCTEVLSQ